VRSRRVGKAKRAHDFRCDNREIVDTALRAFAHPTKPVHVITSAAASTPSLREARDKIAKQFCADATKQSRVFPRRDSGLLRCARNDGGCGYGARSLLSRTRCDALGVAALSRDPEGHTNRCWVAPALQRSAEVVLCCARGTRRESSSQQKTRRFRRVFQFTLPLALRLRLRLQAGIRIGPRARLAGRGDG